MIDRRRFFDGVRADPFGGRLTQGQVEGMNNLLDVWEQYFADGEVGELAYDLGTAYHETAATMQPITERGGRSYFNKYEPSTRIGRILGNTVAGDGYRFRGEGHVQNTGRRNARVATDRINALFGLEIDLVAHPDQRGDPLVSAISLFLGNREGWWTGKALAHYIDEIDEDDDEDLREFINARRVVNGTDKAAKIGGYALAFERALKAAGYRPATPWSSNPWPPIDLPDEHDAPEEPTAGSGAAVAGGVAAVGVSVAMTFWERLSEWVQGWWPF